MKGFWRNEQGVAHLGAMPLGRIVSLVEADPRATLPAYVYDVDGVQAAATEAVAALAGAGWVAYALKANSAGTLVRAVAAAGAGADAVSGAELSLALECGIPPERIVMSGVAKTNAELDAAIGAGIAAIQAESIEELQRIAQRATALGARARVSVRLNPGVEIDSHAHISTGHAAAKFGIVRTAWPAVLETVREQPSLDLAGVSVHVGSMLASVEPYLASARVACETAKAWRGAGLPLRFVDFGGGFGIDQGAGAVPTPGHFARAALQLAREQGLGDLQVVIEPGRSLVGPFGVLVAGVVQCKVAGGQRFILLNAGMNDLLRPALYGAHHRVEALDQAPSQPQWRVVGPVCESADDFGSHPLGVSPPVAVAIRDAGAYGFTLASEYNGRSLPCEIFVRDGQVASVSPTPGWRRWVEARCQA